MIKDCLQKLIAAESLSTDETIQCVEEIVDGTASDAQIAAFLTALRQKGETGTELAGLVTAFKRHAVKVPHHQNQVFDCCGTGGDGSQSFNISTAAAIVIAAADVPTAKHGNRAVSSACGSADLLEAAGARIGVPPEHSAAMLDEIGFCFLFAPLYHPATKRVAIVRRELGFRTVFNLLGPLLNPAQTTHQMIGTSSAANGRLIASANMHLTGLKMVAFHNSHGLDELLPSGINYSFWVQDGVLQEANVELPAFIANGLMPESIRGGDSDTNVRLLRQVLNAEESAITKVTLLNSAFGLLCADRVKSITDGYRLAEETLRSGTAKKLFERYIEYSNASV